MTAAIQQRYWSRVDASAGMLGCWPWMGSRDEKGYGRFSLSGKSTPAHRIAYETTVGPIPDGLQLDHLCRNHPCCNLLHLEPVTLRENVRRGAAVRTGWRPDRDKVSATRKTHCRRGHPFTPENSYVWPDGQRRRCLTCHAIEHRDARARAALLRHGVAA